MFNFLKLLGVKPDAIIGYGVGELSAASFSGAMATEDGLKLSIYLGRINRINKSDQNSGNLLSDFSFTPNQISFGSPSCEILSGSSRKTIKNEISTAEYWNKWPCLEVNTEALEDIAEDYNITQFYYDSNKESWENFLIFLSKLYMSCYKIDWNLFYKHNSLKKYKLPTYYFNKKKHWLGDSEDATVV